ncbi:MULTISPECIES: hypothetical protein [unclassified Wolbachia]|nr:MULTISPECIES: hypothetical protein [unclassified Wolbachia]
MSEKMANKYVGLVDYQELESNILSSIREGRYRLVSQQENYRN